MNWFIYAYPEKYGGLHGAFDYDLVQCNYNEACEIGYELAYSVVESFLREDEIYSHEAYMQEFHNGAEWDECYNNEYWDIFDEVMQEQCSYEIYPLKEGVTEEDYKKWQKENMPPHDFIQRYCREFTNKDFI